MKFLEKIQSLLRSFFLCFHKFLLFSTAIAGGGCTCSACRSTTTGGIGTPVRRCRGSPVGLPPRPSPNERGSNARQHRRIRRLRPVMLASCLSAFSLLQQLCFIHSSELVLKTLNISEDIFSNIFRQAFCGGLWGTFCGVVKKQQLYL